MSRPPTALLAVVAVLALGTLGATALGSPAVRAARAASVELVGAQAVCPALEQRPGVLDTRVSVGSAPLPTGRRATGGTIQAAPVSGPAVTTPVPITQPGQVAVGLGTRLSDGLSVDASGALAVGLEVEQISTGQAGRQRGLAGLRCGAPSPDVWFLGGSTGVDDTLKLVLANVEDTSATVDVSILSSAGLVDPRPGQGISVPPHGRQFIDVASLAPDRSTLAIHVLSRRGRVVAGVLHTQVKQGAPAGVDWVPQTAPPATKVVVPGFPQGPGTRWLYVANPGPDDTTVSVQVTTGDGQFVPTGLDAVNVPGFHSVIVTLTPLATTSALAATVTSSGAPVIASGAVYDFQNTPIHEFGYTAGSEPLNGPALITDVTIDRPTESTLIMSALDTAGTVVLTPIQVIGDRGALPPPRTIHIPAGRTVTYRLSTFFPPGTTRRLALEVRVEPDSGPVYAARYLRAHGAHGPLTTLLDLQGPAELVARPAVGQDPQAGYRH